MVTPTRSPHAAPLSTSAIYFLLAQPLDSPKIHTWLLTLLHPSPAAGSPTLLLVPTIKSYPEAQYHTYLVLGLDIIYAPSPAAQSSESRWKFDRIDIYNPVTGAAAPVGGSSRRRPPPVYTPPQLPMVIQLAQVPVIPSPPTPSASTSTLPTFGHGQATSSTVEVERSVDSNGRPEPFFITAETTGREFVAGLGEPSRKGGAQGWVGPWLEWSDLRVMIKRRERIRDPHQDMKSREGGDDDDEKEQRAEDEGESEHEEEVSVGLMVELRHTYREPTEEEAKKGMGGVWDQAANWGWGCVKIFRVGSTL